MNDPKPLTPDARALDDGTPITGIPIRLADGNEWLLARVGSVPEAAWLRNEMFRSMALSESIRSVLLVIAADFALRLNYDLAEDEVAKLLDHSEGWSFRDESECGKGVDAVVGAYLPNFEDCEFDYDDWLRSTLIINGIAPGSIPSDDLPAVLAQLVALGRAVPLDRLVIAAAKGASLSEGRALARSQRAAALAPEPPGSATA